MKLQEFRLKRTAMWNYVKTLENMGMSELPIYSDVYYCVAGTLRWRE